MSPWSGSEYKGAGNLMVVESGGFMGATQPKHDWRGITEDVINSANAGTTPPTRYSIVVLANGSSGDRENYYFERLSDEVRLNLALPRNAVGEGDFRDLESYLERTERGERLYLVFLHNRVYSAPELIAYVESRVARTHSQLDSSGRGFITYQGALTPRK